MIETILCFACLLFGVALRNDTLILASAIFAVSSRISELNKSKDKSEIENILEETVGDADEMP